MSETLLVDTLILGFAAPYYSIVMKFGAVKAKVNDVSASTGRKV